MPVFVFSVYDTVWKAAVSFFLRPESVMIKLGCREVSWPPKEGAGLTPIVLLGSHEAALREGSSCTMRLGMAF